MWFFGARNQPESGKDGAASRLGSGPVDMTTLDITYITHRLLAIGCPVDGPSDRKANRNNIDDLASWLLNDHKGHFLIWNVSDYRADGRGGNSAVTGLSGGGGGSGAGSDGGRGVVEVSNRLHQRLNGQVLDIPWVSPNRRCYVPSIRHLFRICYSIKGWLDLDPSNMAAVFCANGKARTSVVLACFLRFDGEESSALEAYQRVWAKRDARQEPEQVMQHTPPSLFALFDNFDHCMSLGRPPRGGTGGGLLVGMAINGLPLAEPPVLELYGPTQPLYSSADGEEGTVLWNGDQGFFKVNCALSGDFVVIARFKGRPGVAAPGPEGVLFRYCNHTCFLPVGDEVNLSKSKVDVMPIYRDQIQEGVFNLSLMIVPEEEDDGSSSFAFQEQDHVKVGRAASQQGLADLSSFHHVTPLLPRLDKLLGQGFPPEASTLALQLSNNELSAAVAMMEETPLQDLMTFRLTLSPRSSEGSSPNRRARFKSISVVSPGSMLESDQGDLSLDQYDDSHHSSGAVGTNMPSTGPLNSAIMRLGVGVVSNGGAPWGSGMGGGDKGDPHHAVVHGGIWMPTPKTQGTSSFSPSSSLGASGDAGGGGAPRGGRSGGSVQNAGAGGFFGNDEPRCARCNHSDASDQSQIITCGNCGKGFHTFCVGEKRIPYALSPPEQRGLHDAFVREHFGSRWHCSKCQTQAAQALHASPPKPSEPYTPPFRYFDSARKPGAPSMTLSRGVSRESMVDDSQAKEATSLSILEFSPGPALEKSTELQATIFASETEEGGDETRAGDGMSDAEPDVILDENFEAEASRCDSRGEARRVVKETEIRSADVKVAEAVKGAGAGAHGEAGVERLEDSIPIRTATASEVAAEDAVFSVGPVEDGRGTAGEGPGALEAVLEVPEEQDAESADTGQAIKMVESESGRFPADEGNDCEQCQADAQENTVEEEGRGKRQLEGEPSQADEQLVEMGGNEVDGSAPEPGLGVAADGGVSNADTGDERTGAPSVKVDEAETEEVPKTNEGEGLEEESIKANTSHDEAQEDVFGEARGDEAETGEPTAVNEEELDGKFVEADESPDEAQVSLSRDVNSDEAETGVTATVGEEVFEGDIANAALSPDVALEYFSGGAAGMEIENGSPMTVIEGVLEGDTDEAQQDVSVDKAGDEAETRDPTAVVEGLVEVKTVEADASPDKAQKDVSGDAGGHEPEARDPTAIVEGALEDEAGASPDEAQLVVLDDKACDEAETREPTAVVEGTLEGDTAEADASLDKAQEGVSGNAAGDEAETRGPTAVAEGLLEGDTVEANASPGEAQKDFSGDKAGVKAERGGATAIVEVVLEGDTVEADASPDEAQQDVSGDEAGDEAKRGGATAVIEGDLEGYTIEADASLEKAQESVSSDAAVDEAKRRSPAAVVEEFLEGDTVEAQASPDKAREDVLGKAGGNEPETSDPTAIVEVVLEGDTVELGASPDEAQRDVSGDQAGDEAERGGATVVIEGDLEGDTIEADASLDKAQEGVSGDATGNEIETRGPTAVEGLSEGDIAKADASSDKAQQGVSGDPAGDEVETRDPTAVVHDTVEAGAPPDNAQEVPGDKAGDEAETRAPTAVVDGMLKGDTVASDASPDEVQEDVSGNAAGDETETGRPTADVERMLEGDTVEADASPYVTGASTHEAQQDVPGNQAGDEAQTGGPTDFIEEMLKEDTDEAGASPDAAGASPDEEHKDVSGYKAGDEAETGGATPVVEGALEEDTVEADATRDEAQEGVSGDAGVEVVPPLKVAEDDGDVTARGEGAALKYSTESVEGGAEEVIDSPGTAEGGVVGGEAVELGDPAEVVQEGVGGDTGGAVASPDVSESRVGGGADEEVAALSVEFAGEVRPEGDEAIDQLAPAAELASGYADTDAAATLPAAAADSEPAIPKTEKGGTTAVSCGGPATAMAPEMVQSRDGATVPESANVESSSPSLLLATSPTRSSTVSESLERPAHDNQKGQGAEPEPPRGALLLDFPRWTTSSGGEPASRTTVTVSPKSTRSTDSPRAGVGEVTSRSPGRSPRKPNRRRVLVETSKGPIWRPPTSPRRKSVVDSGQTTPQRGKCPLQRSPRSPLSSSSSSAVPPAPPELSTTDPPTVTPPSKVREREGRLARRAPSSRAPMRRSSSSSVVVRASSGSLLEGAKIGDRSGAFGGGDDGVGGRISVGAGGRRGSAGSVASVGSDAVEDDASGGENGEPRSRAKGRAKLRRSGSLNSLVEEGDDSAASRGRAMTMANEELGDLDKDVADVCASIQKESGLTPEKFKTFQTAVEKSHQRSPSAPCPPTSSIDEPEEANKPADEHERQPGKPLWGVIDWIGGIITGGAREQKGQEGEDKTTPATADDEDGETYGSANAQEGGADGGRITDGCKSIESADAKKGVEGVSVTDGSEDGDGGKGDGGSDANMAIALPSVSLPAGIASQLAATRAAAALDPRKDPEYAKYFAMLEAGVPRQTVELAMVMEGKYPAVLNTPVPGPAVFEATSAAASEAALVALRWAERGSAIPRLERRRRRYTPTPSPTSTAAAAAEEEVKEAMATLAPAREHPQYARFFVMLHGGTPRGDVVAAMEAKEVDIAVLDAPEAMFPLPAPGERCGEAAREPGAQTRSELADGAEAAAAAAKAAAEEIERLLTAQTKEEKEEKGKEDKRPSAIEAREHPSYFKYFKMVKMGMPRGAALQKMARDGVDEAILDAPDAMIPMSTEEEAELEERRQQEAIAQVEESAGDVAGGEGAAETTSKGPPEGMAAAKDHPDYLRYFKMLRMGMERGAALQAMLRDGVDQAILDTPDSLFPLPAGEESSSADSDAAGSKEAVPAPPAVSIVGIPAAPPLPGTSAGGIPPPPPLSGGAVPSGIPAPPPLPGMGGIPTPPPLPGMASSVPTPPPLPGSAYAGSISAAPPPPGCGSIPAAPPLPGARCVPLAPPLPGVGPIPSAPPLPGAGAIPPAPPLPGAASIPQAPPLPGVGSIPHAPPLPGAGSIPPAPPLPCSGSIPPAPPLPGVGTIPQAPPLPGAASIPPASSLPGARSIPPAPPLPCAVGIPPAPPLPGAWAIPPAPPLPGVGGIPPAPPLPGMASAENIPNPPPLPGIGGGGAGIPPPPPLPGMARGVPAPAPLPGAGGARGIPPPPPLPGMGGGGIPAPPPLPVAGGPGGIPPPPPLPGMGRGLPMPPPLPGLGRGPPMPPPLPGIARGPGGLPPPPPMPGMGGAARGLPPLPPRGMLRPPARSSLPKKPKDKRRKLHWKIIPQARLQRAQESIWAAVEESSDIQIDQEEFEKLWVEKAEVVAAKKKAEEAKKKDVKKKEAPKEIALLDAKRAMNTSIAIARIKMTYAETRQTIMDMDETALASNVVQSLQEFMPTKEEEMMLLNFNGDKALLGGAEKFMLEMIKVPKREQRLQGMLFKQLLAGRVEDMRSMAGLINSACLDVRLSRRLKKLLGIILKLGNQLNEGQTTGFTLDSLLKLNTAKAFDKKTSILHYLVMLAKRNDPSLLDFKDDLKHVFPASRLLISTVTTELNDLNKGFASFKRVVEGDPNLRPKSTDAPTPKGPGQPPSPSCLDRTVSSGSVCGSGGGGESDGTGESSPQSTRSEKLASLSMQKTENRKSVASSGKVIVNYDKATEKGDGNCGIGGLPTVKEAGGAGDLDRGDSRWISSGLSAFSFPLPRGLAPSDVRRKALSRPPSIWIPKGLAECSLPLPSRLDPDNEGKPSSQGLAGASLHPSLKETIKWISEGLADCPIPMPSKLAPPPGKRSPPPAPTPTRTPKRSPKKMEPREALGLWMKKAEEDLAACATLVQEMQSNFAGALSYFGEDPELTPQEFFTTLHSFIQAFDEAKVYVDRQAKKKEQERKLEEKKKAAAARKKRLEEEKKRAAAESLRKGAQSAASDTGASAEGADNGAGGGEKAAQSGRESVDNGEGGSATKIEEKARPPWASKGRLKPGGEKGPSSEAQLEEGISENTADGDRERPSTVAAENDSPSGADKSPPPALVPGQSPGDEEAGKAEGNGNAKPGAAHGQEATVDGVEPPPPSVGDSKSVQVGESPPEETSADTAEGDCGNKDVDAGPLKTAPQGSIQGGESPPDETSADTTEGDEGNEGVDAGPLKTTPQGSIQGGESPPEETLADTAEGDGGNEGVDAGQLKTAPQGSTPEVEGAQSAVGKVDADNLVNNADARDGVPPGALTKGDTSDDAGDAPAADTADGEGAHATVPEESEAVGKEAEETAGACGGPETTDQGARDVTSGGAEDAVDVAASGAKCEEDAAVNTSTVWTVIAVDESAATVDFDDASTRDEDRTADELQDKKEGRDKSEPLPSSSESVAKNAAVATSGAPTEEPLEKHAEDRREITSDALQSNENTVVRDSAGEHGGEVAADFSDERGDERPSDGGQEEDVESRAVVAGHADAELTVGEEAIRHRDATETSDAVRSSEEAADTDREKRDCVPAGVSNAMPDAPGDKAESGKEEDAVVDGVAMALLPPSDSLGDGAGVATAEATPEPPLEEGEPETPEVEAGPEAHGEVESSGEVDLMLVGRRKLSRSGATSNLRVDELLGELAASRKKKRREAAEKRKPSSLSPAPTTATASSEAGESPTSVEDRSLPADEKGRNDNDHTPDASKDGDASDLTSLAKGWTRDALGRLVRTGADDFITPGEERDVDGADGGAVEHVEAGLVEKGNIGARKGLKQENVPPGREADSSAQDGAGLPPKEPPPTGAAAEAVLAATPEAKKGDVALEPSNADFKTPDRSPEDGTGGGPDGEAGTFRRKQAALPPGPEERRAARRLGTSMLDDRLEYGRASAALAGVSSSSTLRGTVGVSESAAPTTVVPTENGKSDAGAKSAKPRETRPGENLSPSGDGENQTPEKTTGRSGKKPVKPRKMSAAAARKKRKHQERLEAKSRAALQGTVLGLDEAIVITEEVVDGEGKEAGRGNVKGKERATRAAHDNGDGESSQRDDSADVGRSDAADDARARAGEEEEGRRKDGASLSEDVEGDEAADEGAAVAGAQGQGQAEGSWEQPGEENEPSATLFKRDPSLYKTDDVVTLQPTDALPQL